MTSSIDETSMTKNFTNEHVKIDHVSFPDESVSNNLDKFYTDEDAIWFL